MSSQTQLFSINGLVDTNKTVWQNVETIAAASAAFVTWDPFTAKFGVVINEPGTSVRTITEDEIIGQVNISETAWQELYNACEISFPNRDMRSRVDLIRYDAPVAERYDYEPDNILTIESDLINDSVQADVIAITELKQSRQNKVVSFNTDFTHMDLDPGDIITLVLPYWGWGSGKQFRVVSMEEADTDDGNIIISFTCIEYSSDVYNYNGITRYERTVGVGIPSIQNNINVQTVKDETVGTQVGRALATDTGKDAILAGGVPVYDSLEAAYSTTQVDTALNTPGSSLGSILYVDRDVKSIQIIFESPSGDVDYDVYIDEVQESRTYVGNIPVAINLEYSTDNVTYSSVKTRYIDWAATGTQFYLTNASAGYYKVTFALSNTLDLDQDVPGTVTGTAKSVIEVTGCTSVADPAGDAAKTTFIILE